MGSPIFPKQCLHFLVQEPTAFPTWWTIVNCLARGEAGALHQGIKMDVPTGMVGPKNPVSPWSGNPDRAENGIGPPARTGRPPLAHSWFWARALLRILLLFLFRQPRRGGSLAKPARIRAEMKKNHQHTKNKLAARGCRRGYASFV